MTKAEEGYFKKFIGFLPQQMRRAEEGFFTGAMELLHRGCVGLAKGPLRES